MSQQLRALAPGVSEWTAEATQILGQAEVTQLLGQIPISGSRDPGTFPARGEVTTWEVSDLQIR